MKCCATMITLPTLLTSKFSEICWCSLYHIFIINANFALPPDGRVPCRNVEAWRTGQRTLQCAASTVKGRGRGAS